MTNYDPKTLEAWFRFMAEAARNQTQAAEMMTAIAEASSPEAWAKLLDAYAPAGGVPAQTEMFTTWSEA